MFGWLPLCEPWSDFGGFPVTYYGGNSILTVEIESCRKGRIDIFGDVLQMSMVYTPTSQQPLTLLTDTLLFRSRLLSWEGRSYLLPAGDEAAFCNAVNNGLEPRTNPFGTVLLREGDHEKPASLANAPAWIQQCIVRKDLRWTVEEVRPIWEMGAIYLRGSLELLFSVAPHDGVYEGMLGVACGADGAPRTYVVTKLGIGTDPLRVIAETSRWEPGDAPTVLLPPGVDACPE